MRPLLFIAALTLLFGCAQEVPRPKTIGLQPFGEIPAEWMDSIRLSLEQEHGARVMVLPAQELPASAFTNYKSPRYRADSLLRCLLRIKPDSIDLILGITRCDISVTKYGPDGKVLEPADRYADFGIFGLGYRPGHASIISSFRLGEGHARFIQRMRKVAIHEVGHNRSLEHCPNPGCVMQAAAEHLSTIDQERATCCADCRRKFR